MVKRDLLPLSVGWHGKLPARGDFVGRGLARPWLRTWDDWLQRALALAAQRWGSQLRERLQAMPPWQGLVRPLQPRTPAHAVVVIASCDRVGRAWPLLLAECHDESALGAATIAAWQARALDVAQSLHAVAPRASLREFEALAAQIGGTAWPLRPDGTRIADLFARWPEAASCWWRVEPDADRLAPRVQPWPPRETLLLDWLGEDDTLPGESALAP